MADSVSRINLSGLARELTASERRGITSAYAEERGISLKSAQKAMQRYLGTYEGANAESKRLAPVEVGKLITGYFKANPSRESISENVAVGVKSKLIATERFLSRSEAEGRAAQLVTTAQRHTGGKDGLYYANRADKIDVKYLAPGTSYREWNPSKRKYTTRKVDQNGLWTVQTRGRLEPSPKDKKRRR